MPLLLITFCLLVMACLIKSDAVRFGTVKLNQNTNKVEFVDGVIDKTGLAYGIYKPTENQTGWGELDIVAGSKTVNNQDDYLVMYAAGYLEGILTADRINLFVTNFKKISSFDKVYNDRKDTIKNWLREQHMWIKHMSNVRNDDIFWQNLKLIDQQYEGLVAGVVRKIKNFNSFDLYAISSFGDLLDLTEALYLKGDFTSMYGYSNTSDKLKETAFAFRGMCSALIKILPGFEDIFFAHNSWFQYQMTMRIFKHYTFNVNAVLNKRVTFSSYPGALISGDDFYLIDGKMVMLQTTISPMSVKAYHEPTEQLTTNSVLAWQRVRIANQIATNGSEWGKTIKRYNSGTYNNQYMLFDLSKIILSDRMLRGALTVVEQMPGLVVYGDQTDILALGYWASYNIPFYPETSKIGRYDGNSGKYSYNLCPRAKIFRRDSGKVQNMNGMKILMRSNSYKTDPYSENQPGNAICSRGDLLHNSPNAGGCYDAKIANFKMAFNMQSWAINGPTTAKDLPPFSWNQFKYPPSHVGLPPVYNFTWKIMSRFFD